MSDKPQNKHAHSSLRLTPGAVAGRYRIVNRIAAGGMGEVWLAQDKTLGRQVALKFPLRDAYSGANTYARMLAEARSVAALSHPNIVTVHEVGDMDGQPFIAMSYVEGQTLDDLMQHQKIPIRMIVMLGIHISDALAAAHAHGITHRDLKPGNIIVDKHLFPRILDFGLAVSHTLTDHSDDDKTVTVQLLQHTAAGTLHYMAPEQLAGSEAGPLADIFALGIILYELTYGKHPFKGTADSDVYRNLLSEAPVVLPGEIESVPYDLARIIGRCLEKDREYRFQTAKDVRNELRDLQRSLESGSAFLPAGTNAHNPEGHVALQEHRFTLTAEMVRQLAYQSPKMIGDSIAYLDNGQLSDTLVIYLHAWGLDFRQCLDFLKALPYRGIAPTLYGFGEHAAHRFPLHMSDHSILLRKVFRHLIDRLSPGRVILVGHSSGADHLLHLVTSDLGAGIDISGLLVLGCNIDLSTCFISEKFARLEHSSAAGLLEEIKQIGNGAKSLSEWLKLHEYLLTVFSKFGENADPLRTYGNDIVRPFREHGWRHFAKWIREATAKHQHVRFVYDPDEYGLIEEVLMEHLKHNVLGDHFREDTIVCENVSHVELANAEILLKQTLRMVEEVTAD